MGRSVLRSQGSTRRRDSGPIFAQVVRVKNVLVMTGVAAVMMCAYMKRFLGDQVCAVCLPGLDPSTDPRLLRVLQEDGVELPDPTALIVDLHMGVPVHMVITLSPDAQEWAAQLTCAHRVHCDFSPASAEPLAELSIGALYRLRNEVRHFTEQLAHQMGAGFI